MNYKTRICAFLLTLALLCGLLPGMNLRVHAETVYSGSCGDNLSWRFDPDSGTLTIEGSGAMTDYVDMGPWEDHAASIRRLVFPSGITSIGGCAFANCTALTELNLPEGISSIAWGAFSGCTDLTSVMIPASLTDLSSDAFMRCTKLTAFQIAEENPVYSVDAGGVLLNKSQTRLISFPCGRTGSYAVPDSVRSIGYGAFEGCSGLTEIRFPEGLRSIEEDAFHDCTGLTALSFPDSLQTIERFAFYGCSGLKELFFSVGLDSIGPSAFCNCSGVTRLVFPLGLSSIGDWAFRGCRELTELAFSEGLGSIGTGAFEDCPELSRVALPKSLRSIGDKAFAYCWIADAYYFEKMDSFEICGYEATPAQDYAENNGLRFVSLDGQQPGGFCGKDLRWSFEDKTGTLRIEGSGAMWNFKDAAPWHEFCSQIRKLSLTGALNTIGDFAFADCSELREIALPEALTTIGKAAFRACGLDSVSFPAELDTVSSDAFAACSRLTAFHIAEDNPAYSADACGIWMNKEQSRLIAYPCGRAGSYALPASVVTVGAGAFFACDGLTELVLPAELSTIEAQGLSGCTALRRLIVRSDHAYLSAPRQSDAGAEEVETYWTEGLLGPSGQLVVFGYQNPNVPNRRDAEDPAQFWFYLPHYARNLGYRFYRLGTFSDVEDGQYYELPVAWANGKGITNGTDQTHFSPENPCTRGQVVTFLWRAEGKTKPTGSKYPFVDLESGAYYEEAVRWAVEQKITMGTDDTHFAPDNPCTRAQVVTFLWRAAGSPEPERNENPFVDVKDDYYYKAVLWAVESGITKGTDDTHFSPEDTCSRAQVVTFLYRHQGE